MSKETKRGAAGNILVVDDSKMNLRILVEALGNEGYTVRPALNGEIALEAAQKEVPDLILLDILMPGVNGYQVCEAIKSNGRLKDVPVIFISALNEVGDKVKGFSAGGVDYVNKPFQTEELLARVKTHLMLRTLQKDLEKKNSRLRELNLELQQAMDEIKTLQGILPVCGHCKKIRDDSNSWHTMEEYLSDHSEAEFSHGVCPDCAKKFYPEYHLYD